MNGKVQTVYENDTIASVLRKMRIHQIGRIPVVDNQKRLSGILTIHDIINGTFTGKTDLTDIVSSGESISKTIKALNERYAGHKVAEFA